MINRSPETRSRGRSKGGESKNVAAGADIDGPLVDWRQSAPPPLGRRRTADGRRAYVVEVLRVLTADSLRDTYFLDSLSYLQTKWQGHRVMRGDSVTFLSRTRDYRRSAAWGAPHRFQRRARTPGRPATGLRQRPRERRAVYRGFRQALRTRPVTALAALELPGLMRGSLVVSVRPPADATVRGGIGRRRTAVGRLA
jgi:hypothetical protein